jgi:hypothetical protein
MYYFVPCGAGLSLAFDIKRDFIFSQRNTLQKTNYPWRGTINLFPDGEKTINLFLQCSFSSG